MVRKNKKDRMRIVFEKSVTTILFDSDYTSLTRKIIIMYLWYEIITTSQQMLCKKQVLWLKVINVSFTLWETKVYVLYIYIYIIILPELGYLNIYCNSEFHASCGAIIRQLMLAVAWWLLRKKHETQSCSKCSNNLALGV